MRVKGKKFLIISLYLIFSLMGCSKIYANEKINILFISSYSPNFISFEDQVNGLKAGLGDNVNLRIEYMDSKILYSPENEEKFYNLLKYTLSTYEEIDAVVVGDDEALEYCLRYREDIFKDIPMVFFAASREDLIQRALQYDLTSGVKEIESVDVIMDFITKFHKDVENVIFINNYDNTTPLKELYYESRKYYKDINFSKIITSEITIDEFKNKLANLDKNDAVITFYPREFKENVWISNEEINNMMKENINKTPVYNALSYGIGNGSSIGGRVISHYEQGKNAGKIVKRILNGENSRGLYIGDDSTNKYIFDYNKLKEFKIKTKYLPKESIILNDPESIIKEHTALVISVVCIVFGLTGIIIALISRLRYKRKYEESILKAMHTAEESNRLKDNFISNISHELKTPITVIMSIMQFLKLKNKDESNNNYHISGYNFELINTNCYRLLRLLNNTIDVDKVCHGFMELNLINVNIVEIVEELVLSVVPYANIKQVDIIFDTNYEEVICAIDCNKIERVILNLLSNAIKYSKEEGTVIVEINADDKDIIIKIKDDGIGIDKKDSDKIFDRFIQLDDSLTRQNEGSGIGLSIVKAFISLHKGSIDVNSQLGEGTEFIIIIPKVKIEKNDEMYVYNQENTKIELSDIYF